VLEEHIQYVDGRPISERNPNVKFILINGNPDLGPDVVYDGLNGEYKFAISGGILDSTPAVLEAIRNSISIAGLLGTLGGAVVFYRDLELERREATDTQSFLRNAGDINPADDRP
jgi:hypothetical protein